jgi:hypothetical protein
LHYLTTCGKLDFPYRTRGNDWFHGDAARAINSGPPELPVAQGAFHTRIKIGGELCPNQKQHFLPPIYSLHKNWPPV